MKETMPQSSSDNQDSTYYTHHTHHKCASPLTHNSRTFADPPKSNLLMNLIVLTLTFIISQPSNAFTPPHHYPIRKSPQTSTKFNREMPTRSAATIDNSPSSYEMNEMNSFARRMKNLITKDSQRNTSNSNNANRKKNKNNEAPKNLLRLKTLSEFKQVVGNEKEKIVVVRWYAPWCKACKAIAPSFYRLASKFPDVIFVDVPVTPENANLHQGLGVPSLPFGHIYHPTGRLVEEVKISKKYFPHFAKVLKTYIDGQCDVDYDENGLITNPNCNKDKKGI